MDPSKNAKFAWVKVFKNEASKIRGRRPLINLKWQRLPKLQIF